MKILEQEPYLGSERFEQLIERLDGSGEKYQAIVSDEDRCDHWWLIEHENERILFVGTSNSFAAWCADNRAVLEVDLTSIAKSHSAPDFTETELSNFESKLRTKVSKAFEGRDHNITLQ